MSPSKRERRVAEARRRTERYNRAPRSRYGSPQIRSQASINARRRRQRRTAYRIFGALVVVAAVVVVVVVLHNRTSNNAATVDTTPSSTADSAAASTTTTTPVPPPALVAQAVTGTSGALAITTTLTSYNIAYSVDNETGTGTAPKTAASTNVYDVQRPFNSNIKSTANDPESTSGNFSAVSDFGIYSSTSGTTAATAQAIVPGPALADFRLDASLNDLVTSGKYILGDRRTLLGRQCQMYRTGDPPEQYTIVAPTDATYSDLCIDGAGLVLEELVIVNNSFVRHLVATAVNEAPTFSADEFKVTATPTEAAGGGYTLAPIDATKAPVASYWSLSAVPAGYTPKGRYAFSQQIDDPSTVTTDPASTAVPKKILATSYADVYVNGPNMIVVHQGPTAVQTSSDASAGTPTTSPTLGTVKSGSGIVGSTVLVTPPSPTDWFVEVIGTVPLSALQPIANTLVHS